MLYDCLGNVYKFLAAYLLLNNKTMFCLVHVPDVVCVTNGGKLCSGTTLPLWYTGHVWQ